MSSTAFHSPETVATQPIAAFELRFIPMQQAVLEFPHTPVAVKDEHDAEPNQPRCIRGIRSALAIEAVLAAMIYGLWQISHLLR